MKIKDIMRTDLQKVGYDETIAGAAKLMRENGTEYVITSGEGGLSGVLTVESMVYECMVEGHDPWECLVIQHVAIVPESAYPEMQVGDAALLMMEHELNYLTVVDDSKVVGIALHADVCAALDRMMVSEVSDESRDRWVSDIPA